MNKNKLFREFRRVLAQLSKIFLYFIDPVKSYFYDIFLYRKLDLISGGGIFQPKVAVFVIYQPTAIPESVFLTIDHFRENGYAVFLVSNCNLSPDDFNRLKKLAWRIVIRKNWGYDFGAYRDAILFLMRSSVDIENLVLINDSIWFPVVSVDKSLELMESSGFDFVGVQEFYKKSGFFIRSFKKFVPSYFVMFKGDVYRSDCFKKFWSQYVLTSNKIKVMERGERALSYTLFDYGFFGGAILNENNFLSGIDLNKGVDDVLKYSVFLDNEFVEEIELAKASCFGCVNLVLKEMMIRAFRRRNPFGQFPVYIFNNLGFGVIKKNSQPLYRLARSSIVDACDMKSLDLIPLVLCELKNKIYWDKKNENHTHL